MGKSKARLEKSRGKTGLASKTKDIIKRRHHSQPNLPKTNGLKKTTKQGLQKRPPKVPFSQHDNVLLVGEGDFSFAVSLLENYKPASITATCYDGEYELSQKYPKVKEALKFLIGRASETAGFQKGSSMSGNETMSDDGDEWQGFSPESEHAPSTSDSDGDDHASSKCQILYNIDATKLSTAHRKRMRSSGPFTKIVFNFPHVGGLSTDVNRQVRANQQLLVGFFNTAKPLLSSAKRTLDARHHYEEFPDGETKSKAGQILVTLFEGEPYTLWNIRDLARHCGLQVVESFKFPWIAYPGYQHARTIGEITSGKDRSDEGKRKGAWRGEERDARCYILQRKDDVDASPAGANSRKQRRVDSDDENAD